MGCIIFAFLKVIRTVYALIVLKWQKQSFITLETHFKIRLYTNSLHQLSWQNASIARFVQLAAYGIVTLTTAKTLINN